jgi:hypothetical protein
MEPLKEIHAKLAEAVCVLQTPETFPSLSHDLSPQSQDNIVFKESYAGPGEICIDVVTPEGRIIERSKPRAPQSPSLGRRPSSPATLSRQRCGNTSADKQELQQEEEGTEYKVIKRGEYMEPNKVLQALKNDREYRSSQKAASSGHELPTSLAIQTLGPNGRKPTRSIEFVGTGWVASEGSLLGIFSSQQELRAAIGIMAEGRVPTHEEVAERERKHT